jgi:SNF family Na+-dependent transporter
MILSMAGSAVGLGNLWRFPFLAAQNGGGAFIFVYLVLLLTICIPVLMTEITLGRKCRTNVTRVYDNLGAPRWRWAGFLTLLTPIVIMAFYTVVGGWSVKYLIQARCKEDLFPFKSLHFEALHGDKEGRFSVKANDQYRVEFTLEESDDEPVVTICNIMELSNHYK